MKIEFILILVVISGILMAAGGCCFTKVQRRHAKRNGGYYRSLTKKPAVDDIKLMKIGALLVGLGFLIYFIVYHEIDAVGGVINLREYFAGRG